MAKLRIERVNSLPAPGSRTASTMYIVKSATAGLADLYFTNSDATDTRHIITKAEIDQAITDAIVALGSNEAVIVANIAARNALTPTQNLQVLVLDATGDVTVTSGSALYIYEFGTTTWHKIAEYESMDLSLTWAALSGKPTSSPSAIDQAVTDSHTHSNKPVLDDLSDVSGELAYNGVIVGNYIANAEW